MSLSPLECWSHGDMLPLPHPRPSGWSHPVCSRPCCSAGTSLAPGRPSIGLGKWPLTTPAPPPCWVSRAPQRERGGLLPSAAHRPGAGAELAVSWWGLIHHSGCGSWGGSHIPVTPASLKTASKPSVVWSLFINVANTPLAKKPMREYSRPVGCLLISHQAGL